MILNNLCYRAILGTFIFATLFTACSTMDDKRGMQQVLPYAQTAIKVKSVSNKAESVWEKNKDKFSKSTVVKVNAAMDRLNKLISLNNKLNIKQKIILIANTDNVLQEVIAAVDAVENDGVPLDEEETDILAEIRETVASFRNNINLVTTGSVTKLNELLHK